MHTSMIATRRLVALLLAFAILPGAAGCRVQMVADYDAAAFEEILAVGKKVDKFYGALLDAAPDRRPYSAFSEQYVALEADMRSMLVRNQVRALNAESIEISETILKAFARYKGRHRKTNTYTDGDAELDRNRMRRYFVNAAKAEKLKDEDKNPDQD
jgi:hypothetical protein